MQRHLGWTASQIDPRPLAIARILVGIAAFGKLLIIAPNLASVLSGEYARQSYPVQVPVIYDEQVAYAIGVIWLTMAMLFLVGYLTRFAGAALAASMLYVMFIDQQLYSNHHYLIAIVVVLLTLGDCGARYSLDARRSGFRSRVPGWPQVLLKLQMTSVYGFAAVTKINSDFLNGAIFEGWVNPEALELMQEYGSLTIFAATAIALELFLALAFWSHRGRWIALPLGIGFHITLIWVMGASMGFDFVVFAMVMCALYLQFYGDVFARLTSMTGSTARVPATEHAA